ncbi:hypothetical protein [Kangiella shandongensis]|uniref:hypothetical protein n=1 Tax=Kangiella shandongensis TaxID=2763258 RepID=UPI001CC0B186|nr:hypothetical protein [Kangiella shandongensis]
MSNEQDILKQLKNLPNEAQAPDRWSEIRQQIEADEKASPKGKPWWVMAVAASILVIVALSPVWLPPSSNDLAPQITATQSEQNQSEKTDGTFRLTIQSLQQGNAAYYAKLGSQIQAEGARLPRDTWSSLNSLRQAQQEYRQALIQNPDDYKAQKRLFWLYEKERELLRHLIV